jgi:hypothetical protein
MNRASVPDLCSREVLVQQNRRQQSVRRPAVDNASRSAKRNQPIGHDCEGLVALPANPAANPHAYMPVIVCLPEPLAMTDDRGSPTNRTPPRQAIHGTTPDQCCLLLLAVR